MKKFDVLFLTKLVDKYERSVLSKSGSDRKVQIIIKSSDPILKNYWSEDSYLYRDQIHLSLDKLSKLNLVNVSYDFNNELETVALNIEKINETYRFLKRINLKEEEKEIADFLSSLTTKVEPIASFAKAMIKRLQSYQSIATYVDNVDNLKLYVYAIEEMAKLEEDTLKRNFSKKIFNDSKTFEKVEGKICKIIKDFSDIDENDNDTILEKYHIVKTPTFVYIKGDISLKINEEEINLKRYGHELALSSMAMNDLSVIDLGVKKVLTIENLTTFVAFNNSDFIVIYLGGFHNFVKRNLLKKIAIHDKSTEFYHFGDIDAGGFLIFEDLVSKTGIQFKPYMMDTNTLKNYESNWTSLTVNDKKRLKENQCIIFKDVIDFMLKNNCKLEQEAIIL
ncbi:hypothetical protein BK010_07285 [Tenericutes bacterium MO-XQ]|nr:hypothetical protein BK010_07285 [Tenericutes bacterium MO-XQ]